jgi:hypothetical protein
MTKLDFSKHLAAQDMMKIVMKKKGLTEQESIKISVNREMYQQIIDKGYASIALSLWGHGGPNRKWETLNEPIVEIEFDEFAQRLLNEIMEKEETDIETAVSYFLLFTMQALGYHI